MAGVGLVAGNRAAGAAPGHPCPEVGTAELKISST